MAFLCGLCRSCPCPHVGASSSSRSMGSVRTTTSSSIVTCTLATVTRARTPTETVAHKLGRVRPVAALGGGTRITFERLLSSLAQGGGGGLGRPGRSPVPRFVLLGACSSMFAAASEALSGSTSQGVQGASKLWAHECPSQGVPLRRCAENSTAPRRVAAGAVYCPHAWALVAPPLDGGRWHAPLCHLRLGRSFSPTHGSDPTEALDVGRSGGGPRIGPGSISTASGPQRDRGPTTHGPQIGPRSLRQSHPTSDQRHGGRRLERTRRPHALRMGGDRIGGAPMGGGASMGGGAPHERWRPWRRRSHGLLRSHGRRRRSHGRRRCLARPRTLGRRRSHGWRFHGRR